MTNGIEYEGKVSIKIQNKLKLNRKNNGTIKLFEVLCNLLGKNVVDSFNLIPSRIAVIHDNQGNIKEIDLAKTPNYAEYRSFSILTNELSLVKSSIDSTNSSITFTANIPYSAIMNNIDSFDNGFILLLNSNDNILAYTTTDYEVIVNIKEDKDVNSQATISWQMFFANSQSTEVTA